MQALEETISSPIITETLGNAAALPRGITEIALEESASQDSLLLGVLVEAAMVVEAEVEVEEDVARTVVPRVECYCLLVTISFWILD